MVRENDRSYYKRRAEEEELAAAMATDPQSAMIHRALAARYVQLGRSVLDPALEVVAAPRPPEARQAG